jgi:uncharacterized protein (TIGR03437 family)
MKNRLGIAASLCVLLLLALTSTLHAETVTARVRLGQDAVIPPPTPPPGGLLLGFTADMVMRLDVARDGSGNITGGTAGFLLAIITFRDSVTISGVHIHNGAINGTGPSVIDLGFGGITITPPPGEIIGRAVLSVSGRQIDAATMQGILANPARFYADLHTPANPDGALRRQFHKLTETLANTVALSPANEVPPVTDVTASGTATITINPTRNSAGEINGGSVTFSVLYNLPAGSEITGLRIHRQVAGMNGDAVIDSGLSSSNSILTATGNGTFSIAVPVNASAAGVLSQLVNDPTGFYVNLQTRSHGGGLIRGQLSSVAMPPVIQIPGAHFLPTTASLVARIELLVTGFDAGSRVLINGQEVPATLSQSGLDGGRLLINIPPEMLVSAGTLFMQIRNGQGLLSESDIIVVAPPEKVNPIRPMTVDAAKYGGLVAPESTASAFGTGLASQPVTATNPLLPISLDGTTVYVDGVAAGLIFVSNQQVNFVVPSKTPLRPADIMVVARDGAVSRGMASIAGTIPAIFTQRGDGTGAPAGVASADGQNFNLPISNPDGSPIPIDAGYFLKIFGTGMRFASTEMTINIGGMDVTPSFFGAEGFYQGLEHVNLQIPQSLAGSGEVDMVLTLDGKTSNTVKLNIK